MRFLRKKGKDVTASGETVADGIFRRTFQQRSVTERKTRYSNPCLKYKGRDQPVFPRYILRFLFRAVGST